MLFELLLSKPQYIPAVALFMLGFICLALSPILYRIRKKKLIELHPLKAIREEYTAMEARIYVAGLIFIVLGFIGIVITGEYFDKPKATSLTGSSYARNSEDSGM